MQFYIDDTNNWEIFLLNIGKINYEQLKYKNVQDTVKHKNYVLCEELETIGISGEIYHVH